MGDVQIDGRSSDTAVLLLAAAETLEQDVSVVRTTSNGYIVPADVAKEAGFDEDGNRAEKKAPAKKAEAKKAPAKKAPAKKAAAKKTAAKKAPAKPKGEE